MYIAEHALEDAVGSHIYTCGMQSLFDEFPCHDIFKCDPEVSGCAPVKANFYASKRPLMATQGFIKNNNLCVICANTSYAAEGGEIHPDLETVHVIVLPI